MCVALYVAADFVSRPPQGHAFKQHLWTWLNVAGFAPAIGLHLDPLAVVMIVVVAVVSFLIHLFSTTHMEEEEGYGRFFAYMNLFVGFMLILVLADNLLFLYLGWEGVGLCSYLLIGFWYKNSINGRAAMKAFIVTRVGDAAMAVGLFLIFWSLGTLNIAEINSRAAASWVVGSPMAIAAAALLLAGAVGKSAQLPLQTWLPDAMAGPSPVSALIHAATMVTAGVYLIARMDALFAQAPAVRTVVVAIGAVTMLISACSALTQHDIKRVLAYSTISQIGYMFMALGVGAWSAAILHFASHAFFKALLFLAAGVVIQHLADEHDMFRMGGLRRQMPLVFWTFLAAAISLSAVVPFVPAGSYSKDTIIALLYSRGGGVSPAFIAAMLGVFITSLYTFRMVFLTFFGRPHTAAERKTRLPEAIPLVLLGLVAAFGGLLELLQSSTKSPSIMQFLRGQPPGALASIGETSGGPVEVAAAIISVLGLVMAAGLYLRPAQVLARAMENPFFAGVHRFWYAGWGFDRLYNVLFVRPFVWLARINRNDVIDYFYRAIGRATVALHSALSASQSGRTRQYAVGVAVGAIFFLVVMVLIWSWRG